MKLRIHKGGVLSKELQRHLIKWTLRELFGRVPNKLNLSIYHDLEDIKGLNGLYWGFKKLPYGYYQQKGTYTYKIVINPTLGLHDTLLTLFHELTHCKQRVLRELSNIGSLHFWKGRKYNLASRLNVKSYRQLPWEIEAFRNENKLYKRYMKVD